MFFVALKNPQKFEKNRNGPPEKVVDLPQTLIVRSAVAKRFALFSRTTKLTKICKSNGFVYQSAVASLSPVVSLKSKILLAATSIHLDIETCQFCNRFAFFARYLQYSRTSNVNLTNNCAS